MKGENSMCEKDINVYEKEISACYAEIERLKSRIAYLEEQKRLQKRLLKYNQLEQNDEINIVLNG